MIAHLVIVLAPLLVVAGTAWLVSRSPANALGAGAAVLLYFALYTAWVYSQPPDGLIWLGYVFSLPGAVLGGLLGGAIARDHRKRPARVALGIGLLATSLGLAANQALLCSTLMHCAI